MVACYAPILDAECVAGHVRTKAFLLILIGFCYDGGHSPRSKTSEIALYDLRHGLRGIDDVALDTLKINVRVP